jgi:manganese/zinc/iron transport system substrate-binding protein
MNRFPTGLWALILAVAFIGCQPSAPAGSGKLRVVATTGIVGDALRQIAGDHAEVQALMGPGVDPHLYKATPGDLAALQQADVVAYNGLHLEGKMAEVLEKMRASKQVFAWGAALPQDRLRRIGEGEAAFDPHIWFDVSLFASGVEAAAAQLAQADPAHAAAYEAQARAYRDSLAALDAWVREQIAGIPPGQRILITAHDAFGYFGQAYGVEVHGLQGISTVAEFGLREVSELADFIIRQNIRAVFVESSVPTRSIEAVVAGCRERGHEVKIGGTLYSDALGEAGSEAATYTGMVRSNVRTLAEALR